jgi:hypothetical protein
MQNVQLFQQVKLCRDVPDTIFKKGVREQLLNIYLLMNNNQKLVIS